MPIDQTKIPETEPAKTTMKLPHIVNAAALIANEQITIPPLIIEGVLHQGLKAVLGGSSKARKTWILLDVALSVASGLPWWKFPTRKGRVLYINFEIPEAFIRDRIQKLCNAKEGSDASNLDVWTLRGMAAPLGELVPKLVEQIKDSGYCLIIIDPIYKGLGGRDENSAGQIGELCNELESLAVQTGAAVFYAAHFSKGNQAGKEAMDRISGSGVWTRDADTIITLTKHKEEQDNAYTVDLILRNLPEQEPFVIAWDFPLMKQRDDLDPNDLKQVRGRAKTFEESDLTALLKEKPLTTTEWQTRAVAEGLSKSTFFRLRKALEQSGRITKDENEKWGLIPNRASFVRAPDKTVSGYGKAFAA